MLALVVVLAAGFSAFLAEGRRQAELAAPLPAGRVTVAGSAADDARPGPRGQQLTLRPSHLLTGGKWQVWQGARLLVVGPLEGVAAGERIVASGTVGPARLVTRSGPVAGVLKARAVERLGGASDPLFATGNLLRRRVLQGLAAHAGRPAAALLAGFLIGDDHALPDAQVEDLRRSGLTHFVAVSGSNVALFLGAWWLASGPLSWGPRRRALVGLIGLAVFVVATRWEPSVVRAATMAGLVLAGRLAGVVVDGWAALGGAVTLLLVISGDLAGEAGFQLSVAATAGVLGGAGIWAGRRPRWAWTALATTVSAQAAVAPLLLYHFGSVPLFAPLTNVAAAPLVAVSTAVGGVGVVAGFAPLVQAALVAAEAVLVVSRLGGGLPQLGWMGVLGLATAVALATRHRLRPLVALGGVLAVGAATVLPGGPPSGPQVVFLDVGQGDAVLLQGPAGETILVDGGPDPLLLRRALLDRHVRRVDLVVATHGHADHLAGLEGLAGWLEVRRAWAGAQEGVASFREEMLAAGVPVESPARGWVAEVGSFRIEVLGPRRHYAAENDGSLVLRVTAAGRVVVLPGDVEAIAQEELGPLPADVLKVPHQGAATSDVEWLAACRPRLAVISVGPNEFGHPAPEVVEALEAAGAAVLRTDREGDVVIRLDRW